MYIVLMQLFLAWMTKHFIHLFMFLLRRHLQDFSSAIFSLRLLNSLYRVFFFHFTLLRFVTLSLSLVSRFCYFHLFKMSLLIFLNCLCNYIFLRRHCNLCSSNWHRHTKNSIIMHQLIKSFLLVFLWHTRLIFYIFLYIKQYVSST